MIDSHAHLEMTDFDRDRPQTLMRARRAGVEAIVTVGTTLADCRKAVAIADQYPEVYAAVGIHPHDARDIVPETYDALKEMACRDKVVAWGEIGLESYRDLSPRETQMERFREQLALAAETDLPVIIHDREAHAETLAALEVWQGRKRGVVHCFSGDWAMARRCLDLGFYISIAGPVTYPKNEKLRDIARRVPLDRLLVETDAPYLAPQTLRGRRNEPAYVVHAAGEIAAVRSIPLAELDRATTQNAARLFGLPNSLAFPETKS